MEQAKTIPTVVQGYLYIVLETITSKAFPTAPLSCHLQLGKLARCATTIKQSGSPFNEVFLIEVPNEPSRLILNVKNADVVLGECRYDVNPFFDHVGASHTIASEFFDEHSQAQGTLNLKITYYSAKHGKIRLRVFHLSLIETFVEKFKEAKVKARIGVYAQSTALQPLGGEIDESVDLLVLDSNANLTLDVVNGEGVLATYTIYNCEKSGLLIDQVKAYQVSLFNNQKAVGTIKYQITWVKAKE